MTAFPRTSRLPLGWLLLGTVLILWAAAILALGQAGFFRQTGGVPSRVFLAVFGPVALALVLWRLSPGLRSFVRSLDPAALIAIQTFRVMGVVFLFVWALSHLPAIFAWAAGLGDMAVGLLAIPATLAAARQTPGWQARSDRLILSGIADFAMVLVLAALSGEGRLLHIPGGLTPAAMQSLPMILIPGFLVPLFILLHLAAWQRSRA